VTVAAEEDSLTKIVVDEMVVVIEIRSGTKRSRQKQKMISV
jgi:hypothetical protein